MCKGPLLVLQAVLSRVPKGPEDALSRAPGPPNEGHGPLTLFYEKYSLDLSCGALLRLAGPDPSREALVLSAEP